MAGRAISNIVRAVFVMSFMWGWYCCVGERGTATFYTPPYVPSACYGYQNPPGDHLFAAASDAIWGNGEACGRHYRIRCTGATNQSVPMPCKSGSIVVKIIIGNCPVGCRGTFDLSQRAFAAIADPNAGKVYIDYQQV